MFWLPGLPLSCCCVSDARTPSPSCSHHFQFGPARGRSWSRSSNPGCFIEPSTLPTPPDTNSKRTRVEPVFDWLRTSGDRSWPQDLVGIANGLTVPIDTGELESLHFEKAVQVPATLARLSGHPGSGLAVTHPPRRRALLVAAHQAAT
jgi:hypothetical protein